MRPFCIATIGAILGIIMGLYFKSIVLFVICAFLIIIMILIKKKSVTKAITIFLICMVLFNVYTYFLQNRYAKINQAYDNQEVEIKAIVVSDKTQKEYKDVYQIKVIEINSMQEGSGEQSNYKNFKILLNLKTDKTCNLELEYGDEICFTATYEKPSGARNSGGFDYGQYLKTQNIVGITSVKAGEVSVTGSNKTSIISKTIYNIKNNAISKIKSVLQTDTANLCTSLILGEKSELSEDIQEDFRASNLSHMLAISGAHVSYILLGITATIQKLKLHKRWSKILLIAFLIFFMALVDFTPSVTRACIMAILQLLAGILFKKSDTYQNLAISSFVILLANPYSLLDIGFQLSFGGTIGIVVFSKRLFEKKTTQVVEEESKPSGTKGLLKKILMTIKEMCTVTLSANILIIPIIMYHFNTVSLTFLISNLLASSVLGISLILSMIFLILVFICMPIAKLVAFVLQPVLQLLILIANFSSKLPFSQILVPTPKIWQIVLYYIILALIFFVKHGGQIQIVKYKKAILILCAILIIFPYVLQIFPNNKLTINFIDVGQGDSMLIQTPSGKTVLIDGGGSETGSFDVGESTLLPYLLDKGILKIDYMVYSHFDSDHCQGLIYVMEKLKVETAVVCKQAEESENYKQFLEVATARKVKVIVVQAGNNIQIDKQCSLSILFPDQDLISSNALNNNSIVAKFLYKPKEEQEFSMLLTGDVEEIAEKKMVAKYQNTNELQATIIKVAHHRIQNFVNRRILKFSKSKSCFNWSRRKKYIWSPKPNYTRQARSNTAVKHTEQIYQAK